METRFYNLKNLANLQAYIDKASSTSAGETLSQQQKGSIKKYLNGIESVLKEKKYEETKRRLDILNKYFHTFINKAAASNAGEGTLGVLEYFINYRDNVLNYITPHLLACTQTMLPQLDSLAPLDIRAGRLLAYKAACAFQHEDFISRGNNPDEPYDLGPDKSDSFVKQLQQTFPQDLCVVDLGTGLGGIIDRYNNVEGDTKPFMWGVESENDLKLDNSRIIRGDIGNIPELKDQLPKKIHAFISCYTFNFLFDPLKTLCDAYDRVEVGGYVSINPIKLHGLSIEDGDSLFAYLRKHGYDIQAKKDTSVNSCWSGWIRIKKNSLSSLNLPLHYNGTLSDFCTLRTTTSLLVAQYAPNISLLKFKAEAPGNGISEKTKAISGKQFNDILKTYKTSSFFFKSIAHSKAIRQLRKLSSKNLITEIDIQNALRTCSTHRFNLFVTANENTNKTDTDRIISAYRTAFHLSLK